MLKRTNMSKTIDAKEMNEKYSKKDKIQYWMISIVTFLSFKIVAYKIKINLSLVLIKILFYSHNFVCHCPQLDVNNIYFSLFTYFT